MKIILILMGIYLYFVVGNLVTSLFNKLVDKELINERERLYGGWIFFGALFFPIFLIVSIVVLIVNNPPKFSIPFTPANVAEKILKFDYSKIFKYRIRIATKTEKMVYDSQAGVDTKSENDEVLKNYKGHIIPNEYKEFLDAESCFGCYDESCLCSSEMYEECKVCKKFTEGK